MKKEITLREGYILDFATKKEVDFRKPEESVRQDYERLLNEDYDYSCDQMDIEVFIQRGEVSNKKNEERADLVIYKTDDKTKRDQSKDILGIVETKRQGKKEGLKQLKSYMTATSCEWGVWTNKEQTEWVYRDVKTGELKSDYIFHIPGRGETFEDIGRLKKSQLKPAQNLKQIFRKIHYYLYSNTNISRKEKLGSEMTKLLFCKIYDEKYDLDKPPKFKIGFQDRPEDVKKNICELWESVRKEIKDDGIFNVHDSIILDPKSIVHIVGELERFSLSRTNKDVVGDAFEVFAEKQFVGEKGEYFTPREMVKMAVEIIDPKPMESILDPACGSGGFLIYALEHIWNIMETSPQYQGANLETLKKEFAQKYFYGIDKEIDLAKICKAYMSIVGDGRSNIVMADSLKSPDEWDINARVTLTNNDGKLKKFDIILTNPPFGTKIKVKHEYILKNYELGHEWTTDENNKYVITEKVKETEPQILFIELCINLLEDGGRMAIVLPDGIFGNPTDEYIREWIKEKAEILAVIDCPHTTFMPHTHTKTTVLILKKWKDIKQNNYPILMSIVDKCGHDSRGNDIFLDQQEKQIKDEEFSKVVELHKENPNRIINGYKRLGFTIYESKLKSGILIPRYYNPDTKKEIDKLKRTGKYNLRTIQELKDEGIISTSGAGATASSSEYSIIDEIPFLRTSDIGAWETRNYSVQNVAEEIYLRYKAKQDLQEGDILFVKDGTYRIGETIILTKHDLRMLVQSHYLIIRSLKNRVLNPYLLLFLLNTSIVKKQIDEKTFVQATLSTIGDRLNEVILPIPTEQSTKRNIAKKMENKIHKRAELRKEIKELFKEKLYT